MLAEQDLYSTIFSFVCVNRLVRVGRYFIIHYVFMIHFSCLDNYQISSLRIVQDLRLLFKTKYLRKHSSGSHA